MTMGIEARGRAAEGKGIVAANLLRDLGRAAKGMPGGA
jgi:hypothetical protein